MKPLNDIPREIQPLVDALKQLPEVQQDKVAQPLYNLIRDLSRRARIRSLIQLGLGQLRLDVQYMKFDLEATRRERDDYRRQLGTT